MRIEADYLIVGGGACGMAFADTLLAETDAEIVIVDRQHAPGGHWLHTYPFVKLHQPSAFYGVASVPLGRGGIDRSGPNAGLAETAYGPEVCAYFQRVLQDALLPTGRLRYLANCEYGEDGTIRALMTGETHEVAVRKKMVRANYLVGAFPETHQRKYAVAEDAALVTPRGLTSAPPAPQYVVIGSGKTGIDVCIWLLDQGIDPDRIVWVMPRDSWFFDRRFAQPGSDFYEFRLRTALDQNEAILAASDPDDLMDRLGAAGVLLQFDPAVRPAAHRCATVSLAELETMRRIGNVIRLGHVEEVRRGRVLLHEGEFRTEPDALHVDCTASAIPRVPPVPVFADGTITLQTVTVCQPTFCAAVIAHLEAAYADDRAKNRLAAPVPLPHDALDWIAMTLQAGMNQFMWMQDEALRDWLKSCRLNMYRMEKPKEISPELEQLSAKLRETMEPAMRKLAALAAPAGSRPASVQ